MIRTFVSTLYVLILCLLMLASMLGRFCHAFLAPPTRQASHNTSLLAFLIHSLSNVTSILLSPHLTSIAFRMDPNSSFLSVKD